MRVNLVASDKDSNQLNVCVKSSETDDFSTAVESCENYISGNLYVKEFDFPLDRDHPDKLMYFSISVTDENGNSTSTSVSKAFTKNSPPVVNASVSKRNNDRCNTYLASVHVNASDDKKYQTIEITGSDVQKILNSSLEKPITLDSIG